MAVDSAKLIAYTPSAVVLRAPLKHDELTVRKPDSDQGLLGVVRWPTARHEYRYTERLSWFNEYCYTFVHAATNIVIRNLRR